jgi:hypothetical protein
MTRSEAHTETRPARGLFLALLLSERAVLRAPVLARLRASVEARQEALGMEEGE